MPRALRGGEGRSSAHFAPVVAALVAWGAAGACAERTGAPTVGLGDLDTELVTATPRDGRVVVVTIDGARWQDVLDGSDPSLSGAPWEPAEALMPRVHQLVATRGVALGATRDGCGTVHTAGASNVSLPGYIEIFTGRPSHCLDNGCDRVVESVLDEAAADARGVVASISSWEVLDKAVTGGGGGVFVSAGRRWPAEAVASDALTEHVAAGQAADPYPGRGEYRPDAATAAIALEYYRAARPVLFHVGLGDTDEYGHRNDYAAYLGALRRADAFIGELADVLATMGADGEQTTVIVTPDHGRNSDFRDHGLLRPESGRTFVLAFGGGIAVRGFACPDRDVTLADIAPTIRVLMGLPHDTANGHGRAISLITEQP